MTQPSSTKRFSSFMSGLRLLCLASATALLAACASVSDESSQAPAAQTQPATTPPPIAAPTEPAPTPGPVAAAPGNGIDRDGQVISFDRPASAAPEVEVPANNVVELNYEQEDLRLVLEELGDALELTMVIDPTIDNKISIRTSPDNPLAYEDIWPLMRLLARNAGISIVRAGDVYQFRRNNATMPSQIVAPEWLDDAESSVVLQITPLTFISPESAREVLLPMLGGNQQAITQLPPGNVLGISGTPEELTQVNAMLDVIDSDPFQTQGIRLYELNYSPALEVAEELRNVLALIGGERSTYQVLGLERINGVLVTAPARRGFEEVDRWISVLDNESGSQGEQLFFYRVRNLNAPALADTLTRVFEQQEGTRVEPVSGQEVLRSLNDPEQSNLPGAAPSGRTQENVLQDSLAGGNDGADGGGNNAQSGQGGQNAQAGQSAAAAAAAQNGAAGLGDPGGAFQGGAQGAAQGGGQGAGNQDAGAGGGQTGGNQNAGQNGNQTATAAGASPFIGQQGGVGSQIVSANLSVTIVADEDTNSLLVRATPREYQQLLTTIDQLDQAPPQVLINAVIGQVTLGDSTEFGVDWTRVSANAASGPARLGTRFLGEVFDPETGAQRTGLVFTRTFTDGSAIIDATLHAIAQDNEVSLLARPSILVTDNQEGEIKVGQAVPINAGTQVVNQTSVTNVAYRDVGIVLTITPHINDDNFINLEIFQSLSSIESTDGGVQGNPVFANQEITTRALVSDQNTIILGGLIQDESTNGQSGVPILKEVPLLGALFSTQRRSSGRRELFVIIHPQILRGDEQSELIMRDLRRSFEHASALLREAGL